MKLPSPLPLAEKARFPLLDSTARRVTGKAFPEARLARERTILGNPATPRSTSTSSRRMLPVSVTHIALDRSQDVLTLAATRTHASALGYCTVTSTSISSSSSYLRAKKAPSYSSLGVPVVDMTICEGVWRVWPNDMALSAKSYSAHSVSYVWSWTVLPEEGPKSDPDIVSVVVADVSNGPAGVKLATRGRLYEYEELEY